LDKRSRGAALAPITSTNEDRRDASYLAIAPRKRRKRQR
jgi:hypothetical protein